MGSAAAAGLRYVTDAMPGIRRQRHGRGFTYIDPDGHVIRSRELINRFRSLVIPPAWTDVWICPHEDGHLQVTARDARGRKQYRYHPGFRQHRDGTKFERMFELSDVLWKIRERVETRHRAGGTGARQDHGDGRVAARDHAHSHRVRRIRQGQQVIRPDNASEASRRGCGVGAAVRVSWKERDPARGCRDGQAYRADRPAMPGPARGELFKYLDDEGKRQTVQAEDVNAYLQEITGREITAKDFRTWAGTMLVAEALRKTGPAETKREAEKNIVAAVDITAKRLGNTRSVCRKYYIHPALIEAYLEGSVLPPLPERKWSARKSQGPTLRQHEMDVLAFIKARLKGGARRAAQTRRKVAAAKLEEEAAALEETAANLEESAPETTEQRDGKHDLERTGS